MNTLNKFDGKAEDYTVSRPGYAAGLIECLYSRYGLSADSIIADIGSGTGKLSKQLLDRRSEVYCVEPNYDMRCAAENELCEYPNFHSVAGDAEHTTLKSDFADAVTTAQAFHWFDVPRFKRECMRIIKPGGRVFLIWNIRDRADVVNQEWSEVFSRYSPSFRGFSGGIEQDDDRIKAFFDGEYDRVAFDHPLTCDRESFIRRSLSSSYSPKESEKEYGQYIFALHAIFDKYEKNGTISIRNSSIAYIGTVK